MLERSVAAFLAHPQIDEMIVALPAELAAEPPPYLRVAPQAGPHRRGRRAAAGLGGERVPGGRARRPT